MYKKYTTRGQYCYKDPAKVREASSLRTDGEKGGSMEQRGGMSLELKLI